MSRPVGQRNMQPAAAASEQTAASSSKQEQAVSQAADSRVVLRGVALLYESPGGNQVDGLPPVPTFSISVDNMKTCWVPKPGHLKTHSCVLEVNQAAGHQGALGDGKRLGNSAAAGRQPKIGQRRSA